jgi:hypothetical protein
MLSSRPATCDLTTKIPAIGEILPLKQATQFQQIQLSRTSFSMAHFIVDTSGIIYEHVGITGISWDSDDGDHFAEAFQEFEIEAKEEDLCLECGHSILNAREEERVCVKCGGPWDAHDEICMGCGRPYAELG